MMERLINAGADPQFLNKQGIGALYLALKGDKFDSTKFLVNKRVPIYNDDPSCVDNSPVFMAVKQNRTKALELFCDRIEAETFTKMVDSRGHNPIVLASWLGNFESLNYLSIRGLNLDLEDRDGRSLLASVLMSNKQDLALNLIQRGADINFQKL